MIRPARSTDACAIRKVITAAFGQPDEAELVEHLRADGDALVELVAEVAGTIVGHVLFSRLAIGSIEGAALAPLSVIPEHQRHGIGSTLTREGLDYCRTIGVPAVVVLGHADYYPRFGFRAELAARLRAPFSGPSFMALELQPGALAHGGSVRYAAAFRL